MVVKFTRFDPKQKKIDILELSVKYLGTSNNPPKKTLINKISMRSVGLTFKSDNVVKS